jgi:hypothetical protein
MRRAAWLSLTLALAGCGPTAVPATDEAPAIGWSPTGEPRTYDTENLWDAIDGAADGYLAYGFVQLTIRDYATDGASAAVEIYDQGSALGAFGVFRRDRLPDATPLAVGAEALISSPHHCAMLAGASYVQARALEGTLDEASCSGLFQGLLPDLPGPHGLPAELALLPADGRVAGSEGFTKQSYLGLTELGDCLHAEYRGAGEATHVLFAMVESAGRDADAIWGGLGSKWQPVPGAEARALHRSVPYTGEVVVLRTARGVFGVAGTEDLDAGLEILEAAVGR